jgi:hypothetical protein
MSLSEQMAADVGSSPQQDEQTTSLSARMAQDIAPSQNKNNQQSWSTLPANATNKMLASVADSVLNAPTDIFNLGKAAVGTIATAAGHPELAPDITQTPNLAHYLMSKYGLIQNAEMTPAQKVADAAIQSGTGMLLNPAQGVKQAASNVAAGALSGGIGSATEQVTGSPVAGLAASMLTPAALSAIPERAPLAAADAQKATIAEQSRNAGYVIPPSQTNPSMVNKVLEGISGKIQTGQHASLTNQAVTRELAASEMGLNPEDLTPANLQKIRNAAGQAYENLKQQSPFVVDDQFKNEVGALGQENKVMQRQFPDLANPKVDDALQSILGNKQFDANATVSAIKGYRQKATDLYQGINKSGGNAGDREIAQTYQGIANSLENLIDRNLTNNGQVGLVNDFRDARQTIAKAHTVEDAMNPTTFELNPQSFAKELQRGTPLTGGLRDIAEFATAFPKAAQNLNGQSVLSHSPLDYMASIIGAGAGGAAGGLPGGIMGASAALARPAVRATILSAPYQKTMGAPSKNTISNLATDFARFANKGQVAGMQSVFANQKANGQ